MITEMVKPGYWQTEVGIIPKDWNFVFLGDKGIFKRGKGIKKSDVKHEGVPCVRYGEIYTQHHEYIKRITSFISSKVAEKSQRIQKGDLLFTGSGETAEDIGKCTAFLDDKIAYAGGDIVIFSPKEGDSLFLSYLMNYDTVIKQKSMMAQGDAVVHIYASSLKQIKLPFPKVEEQNYIGQALLNTDELIEKLDKLIEKKKNIKQGMMQNLLTGKKRLPGFNRKWEEKNLGDCLEKKPEYGINAPSVPYSDNLPGYIRITDISDEGRFLPENKVSVNHIDAKQFLLEKDDIVFARTGSSTGKTYLYNSTDGELVFAGYLIRIKVNPDNLIAQYLKSFTETTRYWNWVELMSMRTGQPGINGNEYSQLLIPIPSIKEQQAISQIFCDIDSEIEELEKRRDKYLMIKNGMMQQLLTGRVRLR